MSIRAAIYARISQDPQGKSQSVDQQTAAGRAAARALGWTIVAELSDPVSASRFSTRPRPGRRRRADPSRAGKLDAVVLWEASRGSRRLTGFSQLLDDVRAAGVLIHVVSHGATYDMSNARDWKTLADEGVASQAESDRLSIRVRRAYLAAFASGKPMGRAAYGMERCYDQSTRVLIEQRPDAVTGPIVAEIISAIAASTPISAIVADLYRRGIVSPTGQPRWSRNSVLRLVKDGLVYIGKRRGASGEILDGDWSGCVDESVFWAARRVLADPARKAAADRRGGVRPGAARWMLSYATTVCGTCGAVLNVVSRKSGPVYRCSSGGAGHAGAPVEWLDSLVSAAVCRWASRPEVYAELTRLDADPAAEAARSEAAEARERLAGLEAQCIAGEISGASFARLASGLEIRIAEAERRAEPSGASPVLRSLVSGAEADAGDREAVMGQIWAGMGIAAKRAVIRVLADVTLAPTSPEHAADSPWRVGITWRTG